MKPILVTGVGGKIGGVGQKIVENLMKRNIPVRAMFHSKSELSEQLRLQGVEIVIGDLTELEDVHKAIAGCERIYFGLGVSDRYLEATVNVAAVAKCYNITAFVNMSQMTVSQMSIHATTPSLQQKLHWLSEQVLNWSNLPVIHVRPTAFLENPLFYLLAIDSVSKSNEIRLPFGKSRTSPIAANDVALAVTEILLDPHKHMGRTYELTGLRSENMMELAEEYTAALGRKIVYVDEPFDEWKAKFEIATKQIPTHVANHIKVMALLHAQGSYDRLTNDFQLITGQKPTTVEQWVRSKANEF